MDMNYLVQRKINAQKKYRRKVTLTIALGVILLILIVVGLVKVIVDEKKAEEGASDGGNKISGEITPGISSDAPVSNTGEENRNEDEGTGAPGTETNTPLPTATMIPTETPTPVPVTTKKVAIDPGHGGDVDFGSSRPGEGQYEKNANLAIAMFLKEELLNRGYEVYMIREADTAVDNKARPGLALENGADIYVSIHLNSLEEDSDATRGTEVWYSDLRDDGSDVLAQYVVDELTKVIESKNRGIKMSNNLIVLKYNELPACLVECGFMSSDTERAKLFDSGYQKKIAEGIANGIEKFLPVE